VIPACAVLEKGDGPILRGDLTHDESHSKRESAAAAQMPALGVTDLLGRIPATKLIFAGFSCIYSPTEEAKMEAVLEACKGLLDDTVDIPLLGVVAAGEPYRAFVIDETLGVPAALWGGKKVFALRVRGSSMIDEGIHDGDFLIVQPRETAENGQTVIAEVDGCVTVKKFHREPDGSIRLQPANPDILPLIVRGESITIRGVVVGVMRKYGFGHNEPRRRELAPPPKGRCSPQESADLFDASLSAIDQQLDRWRMRVAQAERENRPRAKVAELAELGRDLQALREWLGRTIKPGLRRALLVEANNLLRRMQRASGRTLTLPGGSETLLH
jgi:repressor LexA